MRALAVGEKKKRGCGYCAKMIRKHPSRQTGTRLMCPYRACPYTVLDKYDTYEDYMKSEDSKINIEALIDADWSGGRVTPCARINIPVLRRLGKEPMF